MTIRILLLASVVVFAVGCAASHSDDSNRTKSTKPVPAPSMAPRRFRYSFYLSGSGLDSKPQDAFTMDTNYMMGVKTTKRDSKGNWHTINAMAQLDPQDIDTLNTMIFNGDLAHLDQSDLTEQCTPDELFVLDIVPTEGAKPAQLHFSGCAKDYNLLLQPQRKYFGDLMDWFERMRIKYRPNQPE